MRRTWPAILAAAGLTLAVAVPATSATAASSAAPAVRVNQVGYPTTGPKVAYVLLARPARSVKFEVTTPYGVAFQGTSTDDAGSWNPAYRAVYRLSFSGLKTAGEYRVRVTSPAAAVSPAFVIGTGTQLYRQLVDNAVRYFTSERDGPDVVSSVMDRQLVTAFPHDFYPATQWKSDMAWGAAEIALADEAAGAPATLLSDLAAQLRTGEAMASHDPFGLGTELGATDASPHAFGLFITDALYQKYGGSAAFESFAQQQLNSALGANAWGSSFVVGAGTVFPHCMQSEIANLAGSLTGTGAIRLGATTDGPSGIDNFTGLGTVPGMRACSAGHFAPFNNATAGSEDNVVSWPSVEPADDYTAASLFAFVLGGDQGSGLG